MTIGITIGIPEVLQQHSHYLIMKCAHAVFLLIGLAFSITIIWLIANHSAGKSTERNLHVRVPTISEVFFIFRKRQRSPACDCALPNLCDNGTRIHSYVDWIHNCQMDDYSPSAVDGHADLIQDTNCSPIWTITFQYFSKSWGIYCWINYLPCNSLDPLDPNKIWFSLFRILLNTDYDSLCIFIVKTLTYNENW